MKYFSLDFWNNLADLPALELIETVYNDQGLFALACSAALLVSWAIWFLLFRPKKVTTHGSAEWGMLEDARKKDIIAKPGERILIGKLGETWLGTDERHTLICARTGGGKGVGVVIPNLLTYKGSVICNDVKGENYAITAQQREKMGQNVFVVDPYAEITENTHCFNPLEYIRQDSPDGVTIARQIAAILASSQKNSDGFFLEYGKTVLEAFILYVCAKFKGEERSLGQVRKMLTQSAENKRAALEEMQKMEDFDGVIAGDANTLLELEGEAGEKNDTILGIYATAASLTAFLDDPRIKNVLKKSDFAPEMFRYEPSTLYVIVSPGNIAVSTMLLKMIYTIAIQKNMTAKRPVQAEENEMELMKLPMIFLMDEFAQLGHFEVVKDAMPIARGYGIRFCIIIQGLSQLAEHYKEGGEEFMSNTLKVFIGAEDTKTAEKISEMCGDATIETFSTDQKTKRATGSFTSRRLITVGEAIQAQVERPFIIMGGMRPLRVDRITYYKDKFFKGKFDRFKAG